MEEFQTIEDPARLREKFYSVYHTYLSEDSETEMNISGVPCRGRDEHAQDEYQLCLLFRRGSNELVSTGTCGADHLRYI